MVADKEIRWLPFCFRLSAKAQDDNLMIRPKKLPRLQELSDLLLDEAPARDIHDGPASYNMINQLLTLATNSIALCQGAHLGALKMYQKRVMRLCFTKYESASNLPGPTSFEAQSADKRAWEIISHFFTRACRCFIDPRSNEILQVTKFWAVTIYVLLTVVRFEFALTLIHDCKQRFCAHRFPIALNTSDVSQLLKALLLLMCVANLNRVQLFQDQQGFCFVLGPPLELCIRI